ncbi:Surface layer protein precursor [compost metagenome]
MKRTLASITLLAAMVVSVPFTTGAAASTKFTDISSHWGKGAIETAAGAGILNGYADGSFKPGGQITRAELVKAMTLTFGLEEGAKGDKWYSGFQTALTEANILVAGDFAGDINKPATREEIAKIAVRGAFPQYRSKKLTSEELMFRAVHAGLLSRTGNDASTIDAKSTTTRAQVAVIINRLIDISNGKTLEVDKGAATAAEVAWHKHNFITMFGQDDLVKFPHTVKIDDGYQVTIDQLLVLDPSDTKGYYSQYLAGAEYFIGDRKANASEGYVFAYKLVGKSLKSQSGQFQNMAQSFYMYTEGNSGPTVLAQKYWYGDMDNQTVTEQSGLFRNRTGLSLAKSGNVGHNYILEFVSKDFIQSQIKEYGALPIHLERFGMGYTPQSRFYLTEVKDRDGKNT